MHFFLSICHFSLQSAVGRADEGAFRFSNLGDDSDHDGTVFQILSYAGDFLRDREGTKLLLTLENSNTS
jgi:hypothetical protein